MAARLQASRAGVRSAAATAAARRGGLAAGNGLRSVSLPRRLGGGRCAVSPEMAGGLLLAGDGLLAAATLGLYTAARCPAGSSAWPRRLIPPRHGGNRGDLRRAARPSPGDLEAVRPRGTPTGGGSGAHRPAAPGGPACPDLGGRAGSGRRDGRRGPRPRRGQRCAGPVAHLGGLRVWWLGAAVAAQIMSPAAGGAHVPWRTVSAVALASTGLARMMPAGPVTGGAWPVRESRRRGTGTGTWAVLAGGFASMVVILAVLPAWAAIAGGPEAGWIAAGVRDVEVHLPGRPGRMAVRTAATLRATAGMACGEGAGPRGQLVLGVDGGQGTTGWKGALHLAADMEQLGPQGRRVRLGPGHADERLDRLGGQAGDHEPVADAAGRPLRVHVQLGAGGPLVRAQERLVVPAGQPDQFGARRSPHRPDRPPGECGLILVTDEDEQRAPHPGRGAADR